MSFLRLYRPLCSLLLLASAFAGSAEAQIKVSRSVIEFTAEARIQDLEVINTGTDRMYLDVNIAEIIHPESNEPVRQPLDDPRSAAMVVSPKQLLLPPGERKRLRVILRDADIANERVFRMAIKPYTGKVQLDGNTDKDKTSAIKVLVGYDLLLLARPLPLQPKVDVVRTDDSIEFRNTGNTNVLLRSITQCDRNGQDCVEIEPDRLYVGETYKAALPKRGSADEYPVEVKRSVGLENSREVY